MEGIQLNQAAFQRSLQALAGMHAPKALSDAGQDITRKVIAETVRGISGDVAGLPERVDGGSYRDAWLSAAQIRQGSGLLLEIVVENDTPYAMEVEFGTATMAAGRHLQNAMRVSEKNAGKQVSEAFLSAWEKA